MASQFLTTLNLEASAQEKCAVLCQMLHTSVQELSKTFYQEMKRPTYITPASYLDHLSSFKTLLMEQRE